ncbi:MAG: hypothetical protein FJW35_02410 [Acidobacteria bacterium]|nr:hypothetical protein [Acidobacteriota bacterium]
MKTSMFLVAGLAVLVLAAGCELRDIAPAEMVSTAQSRPAGAEERLTAEVHFDIGSLEIGTGAASDLYTLDLSYDKSNYEPEVEYESLGGQGRLKVKLEGKNKIGGIRNDKNTNRLRLNLSDALPVQLKVRSGVGEARLSLSDLRLTELDLECGVGGTRVSVYEPNPESCESVRLRSGVGGFEAVGLGNLNFRSLDFEGGVGGANLDMTGEWRQDASVRIEVGIGGVTLRMPRGLGVRVEAEKHLLSGFHLEGFEKRDGSYYSEGFDDAAVRVTVRVQTGIGGFKISWI